MKRRARLLKAVKKHRAEKVPQTKIGRALLIILSKYAKLPNKHKARARESEGIDKLTKKTKQVAGMRCLLRLV